MDTRSSIRPAILAREPALRRVHREQPARFVDAGNGRADFDPDPSCRCQEAEPTRSLDQSAATFASSAQNPTAGSVPHEDEELGNALADLAVTGQTDLLPAGDSAPHPAARARRWRAPGTTSTSARRRTPRPELVAKVGELLAPLVPASPRAVGQRRSKPPSIARSPRPGRSAAPWPNAPPPVPPSGGSRSRAKTTCRTDRPMCRGLPSSRYEIPVDRARHGQPSGADAADPVPDRVTGGPRRCAEPTHAPRAPTGPRARGSRRQQRHSVPARSRVGCGGGAHASSP